MEPPPDPSYSPPAAPRTPPRRVVVFSGHMIDAPERPTPRFPPAKEMAVQERIAAQLDAWQIGPGDLTISGAARGGDILFAEWSAQREAEVWLFLPRAEEEFLAESVRLPTGHWEERFRVLCASPVVRVFFQDDHLGADEENLGVHARNNLWMIGAARALVPSPEAILALFVWDEKPTGDGPGGTSDCLERIRRVGGVVAPPINPVQLPAS